MTTITALTAEIKAAAITADQRRDLNGLLKLAKGHEAVVAAYDNGGDVLAAAHKVGALVEDYARKGRELHSQAIAALAEMIRDLMAQMVK